MTGKKTTEAEPLGLAERLLAIRKWRRLTQRDAAREIGVCRKTISRIEDGYTAHANTRAKLREWLEAQEAAAAAERALAARSPRRRGRVGDPPAGGSEVPPGFEGVLARVGISAVARRAVWRKVERAHRSRYRALAKRKRP